jgi:hypothetical protein
MTDKEWDLLEEAVNALDGTWGSGSAAGGLEGDVPHQSTAGQGGRIVVCTSLLASSRAIIPRLVVPGGV